MKSFFPLFGKTIMLWTFKGFFFCFPTLLWPEASFFIIPFLFLLHLCSATSIFSYSYQQWALWRFSFFPTLVIPSEWKKWNSTELSIYRNWIFRMIQSWWNGRMANALGYQRSSFSVPKLALIIEKGYDDKQFWFGLFGYPWNYCRFEMFLLDFFFFSRRIEISTSPFLFLSLCFIKLWKFS